MLSDYFRALCISFGEPPKEFTKIQVGQFDENLVQLGESIDVPAGEFYIGPETEM